MKFANKTVAVLGLAAVVIPFHVEGFVSTAGFKVGGTLSQAKNARFSRQQPAMDGTFRSQLKNLEWKQPSEDEVQEWLGHYGEVSRAYRRDVFTPGDWVRTRRRSRVLENLLNTYKSGLIRQISLEVSIVAAVSTFVVLYNRYMGGLLSFLPSAFRLPLVPFNLAAASLGLMLSFRTNVSYQRWNEARTNWGKIINDSRSLARMGCIWGRSYKNADPTLLQRFGEAICSFSRTVMNRTLTPHEDEKNFQLYLLQRLAKVDPKYAELLGKAKHRPTAALAQITSLMVEMKLHPLHQVEVEAKISELCSSMGACERILTSPVPTFYPRHTTRFLAVWLFALPSALYDILTGWNHFILVPVMLLLSGFLLGIEELSNQMEEPFSILPMEKMCEGSIRGPVMEQVQRSVEWRQAAYCGYNTNGQKVDAGLASGKTPTMAANIVQGSYTTKGGVPLPKRSEMKAVNGASAVNGDSIANQATNGRIQMQSTITKNIDTSGAHVEQVNGSTPQGSSSEQANGSTTQGSGSGLVTDDPVFFDI